MSLAVAAAARPRLMGLAYRMLGEVGRAEEVVQEATVRLWRAADVREPEAWLARVVTRLCLDVLRSARARREVYPGPWLPEPWIADQPERDAIRAESLHLAFLVALERLTPQQRAALVLREAFDQDYDTIAGILDTTPANARQLVARGRRLAQEGEPRFDADIEAHGRLLSAFGLAVQTGDLAALQALLADDCVALSDGGGVVNAAKVPIVGARRVARAYLGLARLLPVGADFAPAWINGLPGVLVTHDGAAVSALTLAASGGRIQRIWSVLHPEKLARATARTRV